MMIILLRACLGLNFLFGGLTVFNQVNILLRGDHTSFNIWFYLLVFLIILTLSVLVWARPGLKLILIVLMTVMALEEIYSTAELFRLIFNYTDMKVQAGMIITLTVSKILMLFAITGLAVFTVYDQKAA